MWFLFYFLIGRHQSQSKDAAALNVKAQSFVARVILLFKL